MRAFNLFDGELSEEGTQPGFSWRRTKVGDAIGGRKLGASLYELQPGQRTFPNDTDEPLKVLILSTKATPDMAVYPDSGKVGVWSGNEQVDPGRLFRLESEVDYWDGEE